LKSQERFIRNAVFNLGRGAIGAVIAILLPPILVRHMPSESYTAWVLVLQVVAYLGYLDFGLQTAVGRYIAFAGAKKDQALINSIFSTAFAGLALAATVGMILICIAAFLIHHIFPAIAVPLLAPMRASILIVGISVALGLPASACNGVFVGLQRYDIPAVTTGVGKILAAVGIIWAALAGQSLVVMACMLAATNLITYFLQFEMLHRYAATLRFRIQSITRSAIHELMGYCFSLTIWSFGLLLVSGLDVLFVGRFEFSAVVSYSVSATLVNLLNSIQCAIFSVIMPHAAELQAQEDAHALGKLLVRATKLGMFLLLFNGLPLLVLASPLLRVWIGPQFVFKGTPILMILVVANMIRLTTMPYASILVGAGQQRLVIVGPLMEGFANLTASALLGWKFGAIGVAFGTLIGAVVCFLASLLYSMARTRRSIDVSQLRFFGEALLAPALCGLPVYAVLLATLLGKPFGRVFTVLALMTSLCINAAFLFQAIKNRPHVPKATDEIVCIETDT